MNNYDRLFIVVMVAVILNIAFANKHDIAVLKVQMDNIERIID